MATWSWPNTSQEARERWFLAEQRNILFSHTISDGLESEENWKKLLPWNIEITPYKIRGEWI